MLTIYYLLDNSHIIYLLYVNVNVFIFLGFSQFCYSTWIRISEHYRQELFSSMITNLNFFIYLYKKNISIYTPGLQVSHWSSDAAQETTTLMAPEHYRRPMRMWPQHSWSQRVDWWRKLLEISMQHRPTLKQKPLEISVQHLPTLMTEVLWSNEVSKVIILKSAF